MSVPEPKHLIAVWIKIPFKAHALFPEGNYIGTILLNKLVDFGMMGEFVDGKNTVPFSGPLNDCFSLIPVRNWRTALPILERILGSVGLNGFGRFAWFDENELIYRPYGSPGDDFCEMFSNENMLRKSQFETAFVQAWIAQQIQP